MRSTGSLKEGDVNHAGEKVARSQGRPGKGRPGKAGDTGSRSRQINRNAPGG